ncbi:TetR/AcrR family transcriptional regulator [Nocardia sp. CDC159]|uniref:TetR/AcrR family transcriptional regulator n=1 Tax=Nocardia pulmonis TaxID=2951408 RepID=A0A9X2IWU1_9NOCA|nr:MULTISPECIES: TetR/AcrR family transcriptional regulator [Nocardia]MCM6775297.1 TetR/AcrR family transcriptional regulator [Nocardia pulmonis]MCM6787969.1 TetR/AcrR family transcriptional regulator [Nocardia sp. CDC159]
MSEVGRRQAREKARVRRDLIATALRLFEQQGVEQTTVQQIADAAGVTRRTFHRHFLSKWAVVGAEEDDVLTWLLAAVESRPPAESVLTAMRSALRALLLEQLSPEQVEAAFRARHLLNSNAQLRQRSFLGAQQRQLLLARAFAARSGCPEEDLGPQLAAGACLAAINVSLDRWARLGDRSAIALHEIMDGALATLGSGIDLPADQRRRL